MNPNVGVRTDGDIREMGNKVKRRMSEIADLLGNRDLSEEQKVVADVFTGLKDRQFLQELAQMVFQENLRCNRETKGMLEPSIAYIGITGLTPAKSMPKNYL